MKKIFIAAILTFLFILGLSGAVWATVIFNTGVFTAEYTEPVLNADGTPLDDLDHTTIYYRINGGDWINTKEVPASSPFGGARDIYPYTVDLSSLGENIQANIETGYTATDTSGNESVMYIEPSPIRIDQVSPKNPTG